MAARGCATEQRRTRARQIESQSERGKRDGETACSGECERKERVGERKREGERERENTGVETRKREQRERERESTRVLGLCVVVQGFVRPLRGCG